MNVTCPNLLQAASRPPNTFRMDSLLEEMRYVESKYICELGQNMFILYFLVHTFSPSHSYNTFIRRHSPRFLSISSSLISSVGKTSLGCRSLRELAFQSTFQKSCVFFYKLFTITARTNATEVLNICYFRQPN
jgi:hypothetical protein